MLDSVNKLRATGCTCGTDFMPPAKKLTWNNVLTNAAQALCFDMYNNNYFDYISPTGTSPIQRAIAAGYTGRYVGENIVKDTLPLARQCKPGKRATTTA